MTRRHTVGRVHESENLASYVNRGEWDAGRKSFEYAKLTDREAESARRDLVSVKGFFILPSQLFSNVREKAASDENLNETLNAVFRALEDSARGKTGWRAQDSARRGGAADCRA